MTEKESAHPLSPSASIDIGKSIDSHESKAADLVDEDTTNATKNSVIPVRKRESRATCRCCLIIISLVTRIRSVCKQVRSIAQKGGIRVSEQANFNNVNNMNQWVPSSDWVYQWKSKLPLQTIMRLLQVLVPQVEKICIDK